MGLAGPAEATRGYKVTDRRGSSRDQGAAFKKSKPPIMGDALGPRWGDMSMTWTTLPGGGVVGFDLNKLTLQDFRMMRDHYQVNASLSVLSFMMHQLQWQVVCENETIQKFCQENMTLIWTRLVRAFSQAFWSGYSPSILQWENDVISRRITLTKIKDLVPEEAAVNWKEVDGWAPNGQIPPKIKVFDGIKVWGQGWPVPVDNSLWYPLLMENGNYYGKKLLRPAFTPWFFSIIVHLFANRYFERFGEPTTIGRAPYDEEIDVDGTQISGRKLMLSQLQNLRSRSAVVLPSQKSIPAGVQSGSASSADYDYMIEYLESQMRGADFERYLMRLDEEISLGLFTPLLLLRTADVGSYSLGTTHTSVYMQMLNALAGDWKEYIDGFVLGKMVDINFGPNAKRARIQFRKLGDDRQDMVKTVLQQLIAKGAAKIDLFELGEIAGITLEEVQMLLDPVTGKPTPADLVNQPGQNDDPNGLVKKDKPDSTSGGDANGNSGARKSANAAAVVQSIVQRLVPQVSKVFHSGRLDDSWTPDLGFQRQLEEALAQAGVADPGRVHAQLSAYAESFAGLGFDSAAQAAEYIERGMTATVEELCAVGSGASKS